MLQEVDQGLSEIVEIATSTISSYHARVEAGEMTQEAAQAAAMRALSDMRFEGDNYFFVIDFDHQMIMHAVRPQLNGQSVYNTQDPNGLFLFREMTQVARAEGQGFVDYGWPRAGSDIPEPKRSYVMLFEPWGLITGAGVYYDDVQASIWSIIRVMALGNGVVIAILFAGAFVLNRSIQGPVARLSEAVERLAQGDTAAELPQPDGREVSTLTASVKVLQVSARERERLEAEAHAAQEAQLKRAEQIEALVSEFDQSASQAISAFEAAGEQLRASSQGMKANAGATADGARTLDGAAQTSAESVEVVAAAAEELTAAISEINQQSLRSSEVSKSAVEQAESTRQDVQKLADAAQKIDGIVQLIAGVTEQTNLLALNATIEAARAGEAGKGFAVVASEVKALAEQTAHATESIASEIKGIQSATDASVSAIEKIATVIGETYEIATAISAAMEEQRAAAAEISSSAQNAAAATGEVRTEVSQAQQRADQANKGASDLDQASVAVASESQGLKATIERFLSGVRAA
ncbi:methyl-accepting chemotaxis protein [Oceanicaulis alexandrii]|uniref:methyl-accepting chemotaxis protein n=1 Tax=Oceanicaulis alexandrii TaxID=153233 RepID=UPI002355F0F6|nr:methyl-accepting chemotaxis protein [Oceanicaulis alexandrii]